jgi:hypothetical protein
MIYLIRPLEKRDGDFILYLCSSKNTEEVMEVMESIGLEYISSDEGVLSYTDDPFLLTQIKSN